MSGFTPDILEQILEDINFGRLKEHDRNVSKLQNIQKWVI